MKAKLKWKWMGIAFLVFAMIAQLSAANIYKAAAMGDDQLREALRECGVEVDYIDMEDTSALAFVIRRGCTEEVERKAFVNTHPNYIGMVARCFKSTTDLMVKSRALYDATEMQDVELVEALLVLGVNVHEVIDGKTALDIAIISRNIKIIQLLVGRSMYVNMKGFEWHGDIGVLYGLFLNPDEGNNREIIQLLLKNCVLQAAIKSREDQLVEVIIKMETNIDRSEDGTIFSTPLWWAVKKGNAKVVDLLLQKGADMWQGDWANMVMLLRRAVEKGNTEIIRSLVEAGADIEVTGGDEGNALHCALRLSENKKEVVATLIDLGINVDASYMNMIPLHYAIQLRDKDLIQLLLDAKACVYLRDENGKSALDLAQETGDADIMARVLQAGASESPECQGHDRAFFDAAKDGDEEIMRSFLSKPIDVNQKISFYSDTTALGLAAYYGHEKIVEMLLNANADYTIRCYWSKLPIHLAAEAGKFKVVEQLLAVKKANQLKLLDANGRTPLMIAINPKVSEDDILKVMELLLDAGSEVNARNYIKRETALHIAVSHGLVRVAKRLLAAGIDTSVTNYENQTALDIAKGEFHQELITILQSAEHLHADVISEEL